MKVTYIKGCIECENNPDVITKDNVAMCSWHADVYEDGINWPRWKPFTIGQTVKINVAPELWASPLRLHTERIGVVLEVSSYSYGQIIYALAILNSGKCVGEEAWFEHECLTLEEDVTKESLKLVLNEGGM